jgi:oligopeptidase B
MSGALSSSSSPSSFEEEQRSPPHPRRDKDSVVHGPSKEGWMIPNPYGWMRDDRRSDQNVQDHIALENEYTKHVMQCNDPQGVLQDTIRKELLQSLSDDNDNSDGACALPWRSQEVDDWVYYARTVPGKALPVHYRRAKQHPTSSMPLLSPPPSPLLVDEDRDDEEKESIILDENVLAEFLRTNHNSTKYDGGASYTYFALHSMVPSPSHQYIAVSVDIMGEESYQLYLLDLRDDNSHVAASENDKDQDDVSSIAKRCFLVESEMTGTVIWSPHDDDATLYYLKQDPTTRRPFQLYQWQSTSHDIILGDSNGGPSSVSQKAVPTFTKLLLYEEKDPSYYCEVLKSMDDQYLFLSLIASNSSETWFLEFTPPKDRIVTSANRSDATLLSSSSLECITRRRPGVLYTAEHRYGTWWLISNVGGGIRCIDMPSFSDNLRIWTAPAKAECHEEWNLVVALGHGDSSEHHHDGSNRQGTTKVPSWFNGGALDPSIDSLLVFASHVAIQGRHEGLPRIWILSVADNGPENSPHSVTTGVTVVDKIERLEFDEPAHYVCLESTNNNNNKPYQNFGSDTVIVSYQSLVTPPQSIKVQLSNPRQRMIVREQAVVGYDKKLYGCHQARIPSRDGRALIPVSLVYRKQDMVASTEGSDKKEPRQPAPFHLFGYGAYGHCLEAAFSAVRLVLVTRGIICAIAHVRGGGELGRTWYTHGSGQWKQNSFNDFVDVARWLVEHEWTTPPLLACEGRSAGGLLIGASINQAPELFRVALFGVPFLDVALSMTDPSLPLTTTEGEEWGDVRSMMQYDPILNIPQNQGRQQGGGQLTYPSCLLVGGFRDPRAPYWDSLKFAATLRHALSTGITSLSSTMSTNETVVCVKIDTDSGHSWGSDFYKYCEETAFIYAFLLHELGLRR